MFLFFGKGCIEYPVNQDRDVFSRMKMYILHAVVYIIIAHTKYNTL